MSCGSGSAGQGTGSPPPPLFEPALDRGDDGLVPEGNGYLVAN